MNNKYRAVVTLDASNPTEGGTRIVEFEDEGTKLHMDVDRSIKNIFKFISNRGQMINWGLNLTDFLSEVHDCTYYVNKYRSGPVCIEDFFTLQQ